MFRALGLIIVSCAILYFWHYPPDLTNFRIASNNDNQQIAKEEIRLITKALAQLQSTPTGKALWKMVIRSKDIYKVYFKSLEGSGARFVKGTPTDMGDTIVWFGRNGNAYRYAPRPYAGDDYNYDPAENEIWMDNEILKTDKADKEEEIAALLAHEITHLVQYITGEKFRTKIGMLEGDDSWDEVWARLLQWQVEEELGIRVSSPLPGEDYFRQQWDEGKLGAEDLHRYISELYWELDSQALNILTDTDAVSEDTLILAEQFGNKWCLSDRINQIYELYEAIDEKAYNRFIKDVQSPQ
jgi:hypothetical protein